MADLTIKRYGFNASDQKLYVVIHNPTKKFKLCSISKDWDLKPSDIEEGDSNGDCPTAPPEKCIPYGHSSNKHHLTLRFTEEENDQPEEIEITDTNFYNEELLEKRVWIYVVKAIKVDDDCNKENDIETKDKRLGPKVKSGGG